MKFSVSGKTFNTYGGCNEVRPLADLLELEAPFFGTALEEVTLLLVFRSGSPFEKQNVSASLHRRFHAFQHDFAALSPKRRFLRRYKRLTLETRADFATSEQVFKRRRPIRLDWLHALHATLVSELEACRKKFKASDDFDFVAFLDWVRSMEGDIPTSEAAAQRLRERRERQAP